MIMERTSEIFVVERIEMKYEMIENVLVHREDFVFGEKISL